MPTLTVALRGDAAVIVKVRMVGAAKHTGEFARPAPTRWWSSCTPSPAENPLFGAEDGQCNLHAPNERILLDELKRAVIAEAEFFPRVRGPQGVAP